MSLLPRFRTYETMLAEDDGEHEGWMLEVTWGRWVLEITMARRLPDIGL